MQRILRNNTGGRLDPALLGPSVVRMFPKRTGFGNVRGILPAVGGMFILNLPVVCILQLPQQPRVTVAMLAPTPHHVLMCGGVPTHRA